MINNQIENEVNIMTKLDNISLNALIAQRQSQLNGMEGATFSSMLNNKEDKEKVANKSEEIALNNQQLELRNQAYLNKLFIGMVS